MGELILAKLVFFWKYSGSPNWQKNITGVCYIRVLSIPFTITGIGVGYVGFHCIYLILSQPTVTALKLGKSDTDSCWELRKSSERCKLRTQ